MNKVWDITIPCMCVSSLSDPVIEKSLIPYEAFTKQPNSMLVTTAYGGHCGFLGDGLLPWADVLSLDYVLTAAEFVAHERRQN